MKRDIYRKLLDWKNSKSRKPLVLEGARQTGKTYILKEFAKEYRNHIYLNFELQPDSTLIFAGELSPHKIIKNIEIQFNATIEPYKTLIILDEIQACPNTLTSLKYFNEDANDYHIASAGSLLGVKLKQKSLSFPVGKVNFLKLKPLSFYEFLDAVNESRLRNMLEETRSFEPINEAIHQKSISLLKKYFIVGGMPEAVKVFANEDNYEMTREVHKSILDAYVLDFAKHASSTEIMKIMKIWESIPNQLARENKKFTFTAIAKSARSREYESSIQWLADAGLIYKVFNISTPKLPIDSYADKNAYKIYMVDIGLLGYMSRLPINIILQPNQLFSEFKGALTENYVAQELLVDKFDKLYYWTSSGIAEVDFVLQGGTEVYPLEVKAGTSTHSKSLSVYTDKYKVDLLSRATLHNLKRDGNILNYPLYLISNFPIAK